MQRRQLLSCLPYLALLAPGLAPAWATAQARDSQASAGTAVGIELAEAWSADLPQARLLGEGDFRWFGLRVYGAQLWVNPAWPVPLAAAAPVPWQDQSFVLRIQYYRAIRREQFVDATMEEIERIGGARYPAARMEGWRAALTEIWLDVQPDDVLSALYQPGRGCRFYSRNQLLGEVADADFAEAFFSIWLDPNSRDGRLQRQLLGQA